MKRICFMGASTTEGMGDETGSGWPGRLTAPYRGEIIPYNLGIRGQLLAEISKRATLECRARIPEYDLGGIVFCSGMNDIARYNGLPRTPLRRVNETFAALLKELAGIAPLIIIGPFPVCQEKMPFRSETTGLEFDFRNDDIIVADQEYQAIARDGSIPYLSLFSGLLENECYSASLDNGDGLHPDGAGYQVIADKIAAWDSWGKFVI